MRFLLIACGMVLASCSFINDGLIALTDRVVGGEDNVEPPHVLLPLESELNIETLWKESAGVGCDGQSLKLVPAISGNKIIVADRNGLIQARDIKTGELIWEVETELPISAGPGLGYGTVLVGTSEAEVVAVSVDDGSSLWTSTVSSEVLSVPVAEQGVAVIRTIDGRVIGLDEANGKEFWSYQRSVPPLTLRGTSTPIIYDDLVIEGYANGKVVGLKLRTGKQEWESVIAVPSGRSELERLVDIDADPIAFDGVVYLASFQGGVTAVSSFGGELLWRKKEVSSFAGMAANWRYLFVTDDSSDVWQLDYRNGSALWKQTDLHQRRLTAPVIHKDYIVVGDFEGYVHWLSQADGSVVGRKRFSNNEPIVATPVVQDDILFVYGSEGTLAALTIE